VVADDEPPVGVFISRKLQFFSLLLSEDAERISRSLSSARTVGGGMAGIRAISSSLIAHRLAFPKVTWFRRTISLSSGVGAPSADWRIREISDRASSPKSAIFVAKELIEKLLNILLMRPMRCISSLPNSR
jgi:hypothetical protein